MSQQPPSSDRPAERSGQLPHGAVNRPTPDEAAIEPSPIVGSGAGNFAGNAGGNIIGNAASNLGAPGNSGSYSAAAVPMRVYRELAAELQATQAMLDTLEARNQYLTRQNQQLTQQKQQLQTEVVNVVNATLSMRHVAESFQERPDDIPLERAKPPAAPQAIVAPATPPQGSTQSPAQSLAPAPADYPLSSGVGATFDPGLTEPQPPLHTEQAGGYERWTTPGFADDPGERSGLWLLVAIAATVVTAFGAGYWLVRPLLQGGQSR